MKEQIVKILRDSAQKTITDNGLSIFHHYENAAEVIEEFIKQQQIRFLNWLDDNEVTYIPNTDIMYDALWDVNDIEMNSEEVYELFLENTNENNKQQI